MRKYLLSIVVFCLPLALSAQTQQGYVKTKGRLGSNGTVIQGKRLSGAMITVKGRNSVLSGSNGSFTLTISNNNYYLQNVQKQGYVVTDPDILSRQYSYSKNPLVLVLETQEQQTDDKLQVERKIRRNLQRQLQQREDEIETLKEENKITKQEYQEQLQKLYDDQKSNEKLINEMAERYSKIDYDITDEFNTKISKYILDGELIKADSLLKTKGNIMIRTLELRQLQKQNSMDEQELTLRKKKLEKNKEIAQKKLADISQDCFSKYEIFKMQHLNDSAAYYIELRANLDTMNIDWGLAAGKFYQKYLASYAKAEELYEQCLRNALASKTIDNKAVLNSYGALASLYSEIGQLEKSLELYQKCYEICLQQFGEHHQDIVSSLINLSNIYRKKGDLDKSVEISDKAVEMLSDTNDISDESKIKIYGNIANLYLSRNLPQKALDYYKLANEIIESCHDKYPLVTITTYCNIGCTYFELGDYDKALEWDNKALELIKSVLGEYHPKMANLLANMGAVYIRLKQPDNSLENMMTALGIEIATYGKNSPHLIISYNNIGMIQSSMELYQQALDSYQTSVTLCEKYFPDSHPYWGTLYNNIGSVYVNIDNEDDKAMLYLEKALKNRIANYGEENGSVAIVYNNIAKLYQKKGDKINAMHFFEKAKNIFENTLGKDHPNTKSVLNNMNKLQSM